MAICSTIIQFSNLFLRIIWIFDLDLVWGMQFWQSVGTEECKSSQLFLSTGRKKYFCCGRNCSQNTDPGLSSLWSWSSKVSQQRRSQLVQTFVWISIEHFLRPVTEKVRGRKSTLLSPTMSENVVFKADCCQHCTDWIQIKRFLCEMNHLRIYVAPM